MADQPPARKRRDLTLSPHSAHEIEAAATVSYSDILRADLRFAELAPPKFRRLLAATPIATPADPSDAG